MICATCKQPLSEHCWQFRSKLVDEQKRLEAELALARAEIEKLEASVRAAAEIVASYVAREGRWGR